MEEEKGFCDDEFPFQLGLLRNAKNYQKWMLDVVFPFLGQNILEIGSGIGNMSRWLPVKEKLILSDIDLEFLPYLKKTANQCFGNDEKVKVFEMNLNSDWKNKLINENLDTIVSFNVLEHVENDFNFLEDLICILRKSKNNNIKNLITLVPAHQFAYGTMDSSYGHFRRYSHNDFKKIKNKIIPEAKLFYRYFNLFGLPGWTICGRILKNKGVTKNSVLCFEKLCPWIRNIDDFLHAKLSIPLGQSILTVISFK